MTDPPATTPNRLAFAKLVVDDLVAAERFYVTVLGLVAMRRTTPGEPRFGKEEVVLAAPSGGAALILMRYVDRPCPAPGSCFIGFEVVDVAAAVAAATTCGGRVLFEVDGANAEGHRAAVLRDPAGHLLELIEKSDR